MHFIGRGFESCFSTIAQWPWTSYLIHLSASLAKQYNLVPVKGWWRSEAGKVTIGVPIYEIKANEKQMSTSPMLLWDDYGTCESLMSALWPFCAMCHYLCSTVEHYGSCWQGWLDIYRQYISLTYIRYFRFARKYRIFSIYTIFIEFKKNLMNF